MRIQVIHVRTIKVGIVVEANPLIVIPALGNVVAENIAKTHGIVTDNLFLKGGTDRGGARSLAVHESSTNIVEEHNILVSQRLLRGHVDKHFAVLRDSRVGSKLR